MSSAELQSWQCRPRRIRQASPVRLGAIAINEPIVPGVAFPFAYLPFSLVLRNAVALLNLAGQLVPFACDERNIVVRELAPLLLHLALGLLPISFDAIPVMAAPFVRPEGPTHIRTGWRTVQMIVLRDIRPRGSLITTHRKGTGAFKTLATAVRAWATFVPV